ncbi:MAG TPA: MFS transporter [Micropepsaceae bacterium]|jgi:putative MFS transporter|nr:MFS transporter [Micropepsaceae bacterium]
MSAPLAPAENRVRDPDAGASAAEKAAELIARIESVPFSRWHIRPRVIMGSATFFDAFTALSLASATPVLVREWGLTPVQVGNLIAASYIGQFAGALIFGWLGEKFGRVISATYAALIMAIVSLACAFTGNFAQMFVCRLIQGIGVGGEMPVAASYINELSRAHGRGRFFMLYELIFPIGLLAAAVLGARLVPIYGWNVLFLLGTVPGLIIAYLVSKLPESPRWLIRKGRFAEAETIIRSLEASTPNRNPVQPHVMSAAAFAQKSRWSELFSPIYRHRTLVVWTIWATTYGVTNGLNNWMPTLYNTVYHLPLQASLNFALLTNTAQILVLLVCIFVIDRIGRKIWMVACFLIGAAFLAPLGLFGAGDVNRVILFVTLSYGVMSTINTVLYLYTPEIYPTRMRVIGTAAGTCWLRLASAAGPSIFGLMMVTHGLPAVFLLFTAVALIGAVAATQMIETRNRRLEDIAP